MNQIRCFVASDRQYGNNGKVRETSVSPTNCSERLHTQLRLRRSGNTLNCRVSARPMLFDRRDRLPLSRLVNIMFRKRGPSGRDLQLDAMTSLARFAFSSRRHIIAYWVTTALVVFELVLGGVWDILRMPQVRGLIERLGYPPYFLVILGIWKLLGAVALVIPGFPRLKEWA